MNCEKIKKANTTNTTKSTTLKPAEKSKAFLEHLKKRQTEKNGELVEEVEGKEVDEEDEEEDEEGDEEDEEEDEGEEVEEETNDDIELENSEDEDEEEKKLLEMLRLIKVKKEEKSEAKKFRVWSKTNKDPKELLIAYLVVNFDVDRDRDDEIMSLINNIPYNHRNRYDIENKTKEVKTVKRTRQKITNEEYTQPINLTTALENGYGLKCLTCKKCFISKTKSSDNQPIPTEIFKQHSEKCRIMKNGKIRPLIVCEDSQRRRS